MHVFLTGGVQVGKSTLIKRLLTCSRLSADGFLTYWEQTSFGVRKLFLAPYGSESPADRHCIARRFGDKLLRAEYIQDIFDIHGARILAASGNCDVIIMDELGVMESDSAVFQKEVFRHIKGSVPILGVIKPESTDFLDIIRFHPSVRVHNVTIENRDSVFRCMRRQVLSSLLRLKKRKENSAASGEVITCSLHGTNKP